MLRIKLFTAPSCRRCKEAMNRLVGTLDTLKPEINEFALETIDIYQHPEQALQYQVLTTPTLVINETIVLRGIPKREKLLSSLKQAARQ